MYKNNHRIRLSLHLFVWHYLELFFMSSILWCLRTIFIKVNTNGYLTNTYMVGRLREEEF